MGATSLPGLDDWSTTLAVVSASGRERLLDAADRLLHEHGYEAVGVAELCAVADVRKGSFYYWSPSKQALAVGMLRRSWERTRARVYEPSFAGGVTFVVQVDRYVAALIETLHRHRLESGRVRGCPYGNLGAELATRDEAITAAVVDIFAEMQHLLSTAIVSAMERGEVRSGVDASMAARAIVDHMEGLMLLAKAHADPETLRGLADAIHLFVPAATDAHPDRTGATR